MHLRQGAIGGWGEAAPLPGFSPESLEQCQQDLYSLASAWLAGQSPVEVTSPSARFGFSCARYELQHGPLSTARAPTSHPLLQGDLDAVLQHGSQRSAALRPSSIKLKLARQPLERETHLVRELLAQTPQLRLRIDCNQGWTLRQAEVFLAAIPLTAIDYLEEPCAELQHSLQLATEFGVSVALDESLRQPGFSLPEHPGLRALILKPSLTGSLEQLDDWISLAQQRGLRAILSSSYESSLGLSQLAALATQLTPLETPGLDTAAAFSVNLLRGGDPAKTTVTRQQLTCLWRSDAPPRPRR